MSDVEQGQAEDGPRSQTFDLIRANRRKDDPFDRQRTTDGFERGGTQWQRDQEATAARHRSRSQTHALKARTLPLLNTIQLRL